ncbi:hypothetical protein JW886_07690 [Lactococcus taiwanensis]|uniref:Uncharacterized protein n=1 Tax=Lactococcus taiwanensis TaxID=1151742 RepID=A0AA45KIK8_9LACT|nr:hypothetical protein [Lactococcus taiwanensis]QSE77686.1 hypothetical protein JW886_07690 [Lactococcus taiwanensis]
MAYRYIVERETGEILFDLFHDLITQNLKALKRIAKRLNAVLRWKREMIMNQKKKYHKCIICGDYTDTDLEFEDGTFICESCAQSQCDLADY